MIQAKMIYDTEEKKKGVKVEIEGKQGDVMLELEALIEHMQLIIRAQAESERGRGVLLVLLASILDGRLERINQEYATLSEEDRAEIEQFVSEHNNRVLDEMQEEDDGRDEAKIAEMEEALRRRMKGEDK